MHNWALFHLRLVGFVRFFTFQYREFSCGFLIFMIGTNLFVIFFISVNSPFGGGVGGTETKLK